MHKGEKQCEFTDLVVVCCHSIYKGGDLTPYHEQAWELQSFQKSAASKPGEHETFRQHMLASLHLQIAKPTSLVIFSGGPTNSRYPELSEANSYLQALREVRDVEGFVILLEEAATDSYQNVLFSVLTFRKHIGYYPNQITIITHAFKEKRFLDLHAKALRWPSDRFRVFGINPPFSKQELEATAAGELRNGYMPWESDLYGAGPVLADKRKKRQWDKKIIHELASGLENVVQQLLSWEGGESRVEVFPHVLPWEGDQPDKEDDSER